MYVGTRKYDNSDKKVEGTSFVVVLCMPTKVPI